MFHENKRIKQDLGSSLDMRNGFSCVIKIKFISCVVANLVERGSFYVGLFFLVGNSLENLRGIVTFE